jgi:hypothetical protein
MNKIVASCAVAGALGCPGAVLAQDKDTYRAEAGLFYNRVHADASRSRSYGVQGTYYFDALPLRPRDYPLELGAFVERSGSVSGTYFRTSSHSDNFQATSDGAGYDAGFVFRRPDMPWYVDASYQSLDSGKVRSSATGAELESDAKFYRLAAGGYVAKATLLTLDWSRSKAQSTNTLSSGIVDVNSVDTSIGISGQHLAYLPGGSHVALGAQLAHTKRKVDGGGLAEDSKNNSLSLLGTYYPTKMLGLKLGYTYDRGDARFSEGDTLSAGASWFVTPIVSLSADVQRFQGKAANSDYDLISLGAQVRF